MELQDEELGWCPIAKSNCKKDCMLLAKYSDNHKCCSIAIIAASSDYILDSIIELNGFMKGQVK